MRNNTIHQFIRDIKNNDKIHKEYPEKGVKEVDPTSNQASKI